MTNMEMDKEQNKRLGSLEQALINTIKSQQSMNESLISTVHRLEVLITRLDSSAQYHKDDYHKECQMRHKKLSELTGDVDRLAYKVGIVVGIAVWVINLLADKLL